MVKLKKQRKLRPSTVPQDQGGSQESWKVQFAQTRRKIYKALGWEEDGKGFEKIDRRKQLVGKEALQLIDLALADMDKSTFLSNLTEKEVKDELDYITWIQKLLETKMNREDYDPEDEYRIGFLVEKLERIIYKGVSRAKEGLTLKTTKEERRVQEQIYRGLPSQQGGGGQSWWQKFWPFGSGQKSKQPRRRYK